MPIMKMILMVCVSAVLWAGPAGAAGYPLRIKVSPGAKAAVVHELPSPEERVSGYDAVLLNGELPDPAVKLRVAGRDPYASETFPGGRFWAKYRISAGEPLTVTVLGAAAASEHVVVIYGADLISGAGREGAAAAPYGPEGTKAVFFPAVWRAAWGAAPVSGYTWQTPRKFTLHHTAGPRPADRAAAEAEMRFIQSQHRNGNGWLDIGYHFVISPQGDIFEGRPVNAQGAHAQNYNVDNVGISVMGNYMNDPVAPQVLDAIVRLGQYLKADFGIGEGAFFAHRQLNSTACPGDNIYARMQELRDRIFRGPVPAEAFRGVGADPSFGGAAAGGQGALGQLLGAASVLE